jgi:hypothetical protein
LGGAAGVGGGMKLTDAKRNCIIQATIEPLAPFRRGFARSKWGPFFELRTVMSLVDTGALRLVRVGCQTRVTARAV